MIKSIIVLILSFIVVVFCLTWYLQPDDVKTCKQPGPSNNCQSVDAIVAISGGDTEARVNYAIKLYRTGWSDKLIFSGAARDKSGPSNAAVMKSMAIQAGVPESSILVDESSETTKQNAVNSSTIFQKNDIKRVILVTSGYHQRRASLEFKKRANEVKIVNGPVRVDQDWSFWWWTSFTGWWLAVSELVKIIIFYVFGVL